MKWGRQIHQIREGQQKAEAGRRRLLEGLQAKRQLAEEAKAVAAAQLAARRTRFENLDPEAAANWARRFFFFDLDRTDAGAMRLNRPALQMLEALLVTLHDRKSRAILQWPLGQNDVSMLHPVAMLATICATQERTTSNFAWCPAVRDFRTLYFPWRGAGSSNEQRGTLVERREFLKRNQLHVTRPLVGQPEESAELKIFHATLAHLQNLSKQDARRPHLAHPTLAEIYPAFGALGGEAAPTPFSSVTRDLFDRIEHGAALTRLSDDRCAITRPASAPFAFFGVSARFDAAKALAHPALDPNKGGRPPDLCLIDLGPPGLRQLRHVWEDVLADFLLAVRRLDEQLPILAITHDAFVHRRLERLLRECGLHTPADVRSSVLFRASDEPFADDPPIGEVSPLNVQFHSVAGNGVAALKAMSEAARRCSDPSHAGALRFAMGGLRRCMSLPCGMNAAYDCLSEIESQAAAEAFLERRSGGTVIAAIKTALEASTAQAERGALEDAERAVRKAYNEFANDTPIGSLLAEITAVIARKASRSVLVFNSETERQLGERRLLNDPEIGDVLRKKLASGFIRITSVSATTDVLAEIAAGPDRNSWKRLVLVTPTQAQLSVLLGKSWLPEELVVVSDREFVVSLASSYRYLANHPDLAGERRIGARLAAAAKAARIEGDARDVAPVDLELAALPFGDGAVIDLTGGDDDDSERDVLELDLESGRKIRLRPAGLIVRHNARAEVNVFERTTGRDIEPGDAIVVADAAFVQEARGVLPVRVLAQGWVDVFHTVIEAGLPQLPGDTLAAKGRYVAAELAKRGARQLSAAAATDWLRVADHKLVARERLRPHAPLRKREFDTLMSLVGQDALADKIWKEGILPLRVDRRRAGVKMAQAFASVLVDPHGGTTSLSPEIRGKIATLRRRALEHLDGVVACRIERPSEGAKA